MHVAIKQPKINRVNHKDNQQRLAQLCELDPVMTKPTSDDSEDNSSKSAHGGTPIKYSEFSLRWTRTINAIRKPLFNFLHVVSRAAAENPKRTVSFVTFLSFALLLVGLATNFTVDSDNDQLWTPSKSEIVDHRKWIDDHSGFPEEPREFFLFFHNDGNNIVKEENVHLVFEALDTVRGHPDYEKMCSESEYLDVNGVPVCRITGFTKFWNDTTAIMKEDPDVISTMSQFTFPDQSRVSENSLYGYPERDATGMLTSAQSFLVIIYFADTKLAEDIELDIVDWIVDLDDAWRSNADINLRVEVSAYSSFDEEYVQLS